MDQEKILKKLRLLMAQSEKLRADAEAMTNTLTVLEKELVGSGAPAGSSKKGKLQKELNKTLANRRAQKRTRKLQKPNN